MPYRLQRQRDGDLALRAEAYGETMHPGAGPWSEATRLYVGGSGLAATLSQNPGSTDALVLFDVGLGGAANALAAVACHAELTRAGRRPRPLRIVSFEADPRGAAFALAHAAELGYLRGHEPLLGALLADGRAEGPGLVWELRTGDFLHLIDEEPARADVVFFDPFSARVNPEMWRLSTLEALFACRRRAGRLRLVTYSTAYATRAGLLLAGFYVGEGPPGTAMGRGGTVAATWAADLERPLTPTWLERWRRDRIPWPPGTAPRAYPALRERLSEHPQWGEQGQAERAAKPRRKARPGSGGRKRRG